MKYNYRFEYITFKSGKKKKIIIVEPKIRLVAEFLMNDIQGDDATYVYNAIDKVLNGESTLEELDGNVCGLEIRKDFTEIFDNISEDESCKIETKELREFVDIWIKNRN